ncbi:MAG: AsmA family protein [Xanthobacteraceae bacterium]
MQTTLLGVAIAIILALLAALVGPLLINWDGYREELEARASRLTGLEFKVAGAIDARLLPTPIVTLNSIEFGRPRDAGRVRARALRIEFSLGALLRGEWKIADARLDGPEFAVGVDAAGRLALPVPTVGFAPEGVTIERLTIEGGRAVLTDAASGLQLVLDNFEFKGDVRSLAGPAKGEGSFVVAGQHYPYRFFASRLNDDGSIKVRLALDPTDRPFTAEADLLVRVEHGVPEFDGVLAFARAVGRAPAGAGALILEPWRVTGRIKGDSAGATLDQVELQYGPDERPIKLRGEGRMAFGAKPQLDGELSSAQIDLDRILALPAATGRRPLPALKVLAEYASGALRLPFPVRLGLHVEMLTLAGAPLQRLHGSFKSDGEAWDIERLEVRAPGITQVRVGGHVRLSPSGTTFKGPVDVDANDPRALLVWLTDRADLQSAVAGPLRLAGTLTLSNDQVAVDALKAEVDRMTVAGRLDYRWAGNGRPARIDGALTAPEIDLDRVHALGKAMFDEASLDWPREADLSLKIARAIIAGVDAKQLDVNMRIDASGVEIDRLSVADFGGAALAVKGRIDMAAQSSQGTISLDLNARSLDGVATALARFAPNAAEELRRTAPQLIPMTLRASLAVDSPAIKAANAGSSNSNSSNAVARLRADGRAGAFHLALQGETAAAGRGFSVQGLELLKSANVTISARVESDDGRRLLELARLDGLFSAEKLPGRMHLSVSGPLDGRLAVDGQLTTSAFNIAASGVALLSDDASPSAALTFKMANAGLRSLRPSVGGRPAAALPATLTGKLTLADESVMLSEMAGSVSNMGIAGRLTVGLAQPNRIDGEFELGALDVPGALAAVLGMPATGAATTGLWPSEPFESGPIRGYAGRITIKSARAMLAPKLLARDLRAVVRFNETGVAVQSVEAEVAGGRMTAELSAERRLEGLVAQGQVRFVNADAGELLPGDGVLSGRITLDMTAKGSGRSASALIGSLAGNGSFTLQNGKVEHLDPTVFDAVIRAVDGGLPVDAARVRNWLDKALAARALPVNLAEGTVTLTAGQARLSNTVVHTPAAELTAGGSINLVDGGLEARLTLAGPSGIGGIAQAPPRIAIALKGPVAAPKRTIDVAALASWLALRSVEQQSKKLEVLEGRASATDARSDDRPAPVAPRTPVPAATVAVPAAASPPSHVVRPPAKPPAEIAAPVVRAQPEVQQVPNPPPRPAPPPRPQARPVPPPFNLLPFLGPRT